LQISKSSYLAICTLSEFDFKRSQYVLFCYFSFQLKFPKYTVNNHLKQKTRHTNTILIYGAKTS